MKIEYRLDENLRFIPLDPQALERHVEELRDELLDGIEPGKRVSLLGEIGAHLRSLGRLAEAEISLREALTLCQKHGLGIARETQQKIRLAHVLQEKKEFAASDALFEECVHVCETETEANYYLAFAYQHAAKNEFDQRRFTRALDLFERALALRRSKGAPIDQIQSTEQAIARTREILESSGS